MIPDMHDWTLNGIHMDWKVSKALFEMKSPEGERKLTSCGVKELHITNCAPWGSSVSVNAHSGPYPLDDGLEKLEVEVQSGDLISVVAESFSLD